MASPPNSSIRDQYDELHRVLSLSPVTLETLANKFFRNHVIDLPVKQEITTSSTTRAGARTLLDHLILKVEQSSDYLPDIIDIMGAEASLVDIVRRMDSSRNGQYNNPIFSTIASHVLSL